MWFGDISSIIMKFYEEENQSNIINAKLVFRSAIGPLIIALPRDFIEDYDNYTQNKTELDEAFVRQMKYKAGIIK